MIYRAGDIKTKLTVRGSTKLRTWRSRRQVFTMDYHKYNMNNIFTLHTATEHKTFLSTYIYYYTAMRMNNVHLYTTIWTFS